MNHSVHIFHNQKRRRKKMHTLTTLLFFSFSFHAHTVLCEKCSATSCVPGAPLVQFPFGINGAQPERCTYPRFDLSCNNRSQTIVYLPPAREFVVKRISYQSQIMYVNDPDFCLPKKLMGVSFQDTPFRAAYLKNLTLIKCNLSDSSYPGVPVPCLNGLNYTVFAIDSGPYEPDIPKYCRNMSTILVPVNDRYEFNLDLDKDLQLKWDDPSCGGCVAKGGTCGFKHSNGYAVGCSGVPRHGLPRSAKYGVIIGAGIPGLVFIIGLVCYICGKVRACGRRAQLNNELPTSTIAPQSTTPAIVTGLDGPTIESYPKTVLGDSGRLPKPNDGPCPICLSEYQPKEVLRIIPECNHFFHAECVDEWLRLNATCPLCRNLPDGSSLVTPRSSMSLSSSSTSSTS